MKALTSISVAIVVVAFSSCTQPVRKAAVVTLAKIGSRFDGAGQVALYEGRPCTSQIMFEFRRAFSQAVWLAAPVRETKILTDARHNRRVHISGTWRRGKEKDCSYVNVTRVVR